MLESIKLMAPSSTYLVPISTYLNIITTYSSPPGYRPIQLPLNFHQKRMNQVFDISFTLKSVLFFYLLRMISAMSCH